MNLDNLNQIRKLDSGQAATSIEFLPDQIRQVLGDSRLIKIPKEYSKITNVVVAGMGGSNLGTKIIAAALADQIKVPINVTAGYEVPAYVNANTLYIISSYSGTTEEPLSTYAEAKKRKAKIMGITADGKNNKLANLMIKDNLPGYIFKPQQNPSGQPRLGLGYAVFGIAVLLAKAGLFKINVKEIEDIIAEMEIRSRKLRIESKTSMNQAKKIASKLRNHQPMFVAAEFLSGNMHAIRNQCCENGKNFAGCLNLPDLNHFAMEGLVHPTGNKNNLIFVFFDSLLYNPRIRERSLLTKEVIKKNKISFTSYQMESKTKFGQALELLQVGSWITYYLGMVNDVDPNKIPWVDWFKKQLK